VRPTDTAKPPLVFATSGAPSPGSDNRDGCRWQER